ncbi:ABC transporter ATP-binding protein [Salinicoccus sp. YB14-2]|uniref:ABC transporter ATP-binding protein n=1 Tax=Salinicoccus sp. YB14-2 TaxID=1572701 RepID=UPI00069088E5|nr:ABC transporter ATP-binding protein [Salinicoccus sp. YB14-2]
MIDFIYKLKWYFSEHKLKYLIIVILAVMSNLLEVVPPQLIGRTIDLINTGEMTVQSMWLIFFLFIIVIIGTYVMLFSWFYLLFGSAYNIESILRMRLMQKFLTLSPSFYERNKTGDLMAKATNDMRSINRAMGFGMITLLDASTFLTTIVLVMAFTINLELTFFALLPLPLLIIIEVGLGRLINKRHTESQKSFGVMNDSALEVVEGVRLTRSYVQEEAEAESFKGKTNDYLSKFMKVEKLDALFQPLTIFVVSISFIIAFGYGAVLVNAGVMTVGEVVTFNIYLNMLIWPMFAMGMLFNIMQRGNASLNRIEDVLQAEDDVIDAGDGVTESSEIDFEKVSFSYPSSSRKNLNEISIRLKAGETLGIVGKTGSGKTTLIKQLLKMYPAGSGNLIIDGINITQLSKKELRHKIGYVSQENILFSRTVRENILFGNPAATDEELRQAIEVSSLDSDVALMPKGLETMVGEKGIALSGGQKQRISIARSLIKNPDILIFDDTLSAVDAKTEQRIINNIKRERNEKTTVIVTHRLSAVRHAEVIVVLEDGKIVETGSHDELIQNDGWYKRQNQYYRTGGDENE